MCVCILAIACASARSQSSLAQYRVKGLKFKALPIADLDSKHPFIKEQAVVTGATTITFYSISKYADFPPGHKKTKNEFVKFLNGDYGIGAKAISYKGTFYRVGSSNMLPDAKRLLEANCVLTGCSEVALNGRKYVFSQWQYADDNGTLDEMLILLFVFDAKTMKFQSNYTYLSSRDYRQFCGFYNQDAFIDIPYYQRLRSGSKGDCYEYGLFSVQADKKLFLQTRFKTNRKTIVLCD